MNLQTVSISQSVPYYKLMTARYGSGKISVPVDQNEYLYARFEHVKGVKPSNGDNGISLVRLRVLNSLVRQLGKVREEVNGMDISSMRDSDLASFLDKYKSELHTLAQNNNVPYRPHFFEPGLMVNTTL